MALQIGAFEILQEIYQERNLRHYAAKQKISLYEDDIWIVYRGLSRYRLFVTQGMNRF